ncbi:DUF6918 family protein [Nocardioides bizhenqiangii]|uniref:Uncharacterized protein n=1 Tax=Nocardioides bizhenqiangii TaxID=3095076 RepID=A0ABZ0ZL62_9ACTN|nr:hypothetical protein [Nocardioides sp. HM61]WQQ24539.1 hypothetical protein SHK19_11210 [Nocardioides sp. HM61]
MMLSQQLLARRTRPAVIKDLVEVVQQEVASKKGVAGTAVKAGYGAASRVVPDLTERALNKLLPDLSVALDPFWASYESSGATAFGQHLAGRGREVSAALLAVTDAKIAGSGREPVKKVYRALRGKADGHVQAALPRVGAALERHAQRPARG